MKITKTQLRNIIKEEIDKVVTGEGVLNLFKGTLPDVEDQERNKEVAQELLTLLMVIANPQYYKDRFEKTKKKLFNLHSNLYDKYKKMIAPISEPLLDIFRRGTFSPEEVEVLKDAGRKAQDLAAKLGMSDPRDY